MKLFIDHDVYRITVDFLRQHGHDVVTAKELGLHTASDEELLEKAKNMDRLLITRDKDFGMLIFLKKELCSGVICLKTTPLTIHEVHNELHKILEKYTEKDLKTSFCMVEPHRYRIRRIDI
ncbi:MAG: DUF5615 family PIN-like protein [Candidatus Loosdrechtia sp.]|uniref:DUF5615 family PIN-like protein n=1 Tax=Candidatus Loosdrechtia sp. TaxID=3101272 RepID=UPI003A632814|nr:MAG: DUF5615 family PIN-like protein [Candidatus Jettenia sp. AMX2]